MSGKDCGKGEIYKIYVNIVAKKPSNEDEDLEIEILLLLLCSKIGHFKCFGIPANVITHTGTLISRVICS